MCKRSQGMSVVTILVTIAHFTTSRATQDAIAKVQLDRRSSLCKHNLFLNDFREEAM